MYLAPLNYDLFFKKVFSHLHIAKAFLEDFLDTEVEEIELLPTDHILTDASAKVMFDFRCKIKGKYIIIDMQQWYKTDVVKRFYLYHCASTVLQLEYLKKRRIIGNKEDKLTRDHDYRQVVPVLTLIWMVSDQLEFEDNFVTFVTAPEDALAFLQDDNLWDEASKVTLLKKRRKVLKLLNNNHKELDFLKQNRLVFMFQRNIVKSMNTVARYYPWFEFAAKTLSKENDEADFDKFNDSKIFRDIMGIIVKDKLSASEKDYIETEDETNEMYKRYWDGVKEDAQKEGVQKGLQEGLQKGLQKGLQEGIEKGLQEGIEKGLQEGIEKGLQEGIEKGKEEALKAMVVALYKEGIPVNVICKTANLSEEQVEKIILDL